MDRTLSKNIIATLTYYDVLDYPLTAFEIWKHLINVDSPHYKKKWSLASVMDHVSDPSLMEYVEQKNGFYFLCGREHLVDVRKEREIISLKKLRRLRRIVSFLRISPFVRMICVTGRLAYRNCEKESDLDILVAYEPGHIWTGRFMLTAISHLCGVRRYAKKTVDRVCLNYHVTTRSLELPTRDLFAAHEYSFIFPLFDHAQHFDYFAKENTWITFYKPHYTDAHKIHCLCTRDSWWSSGVRNILEFICGDVGTEGRLRRWQQKKIVKNPKTHEEGALIIHTDDHLVFLPVPHGPDVFEEYKKRLDALEINF